MTRVDANVESGGSVWVIAGWKEGVARMLSQSATYILEMQKSLFQLHGHCGAGQNLTTAQWMVAFQRGVGQSSLSAGLVYGLYYNVYHTCTKGMETGTMNALEANAVATFITSLVKIPISNAIRWMQLNPTVSYTIPSAMRHIYTKSRVIGLYSGYGLSFIEDFIEMALRDTLFLWMDGINTRYGGLRRHEIGFVGGALSGAAVAYMTTPFDTLRCHLTYMHSRGAMVTGIFSPMHATRQLIADHGIGLFYRGARTRAISTGLRMAFFYTFMKICP
jgi:hypothetical protein